MSTEQQSGQFQFYNGNRKTIKAEAQETAMTFLGNPNSKCNECWVLARAAYGGNGPLRVKLVNDVGGEVSDEIEIHSSSLASIKLNNVNIEASEFAPVLNVFVKNASTATESQALIEGVLMKWT